MYGDFKCCKTISCCANGLDIEHCVLWFWTTILDQLKLGMKSSCMREVLILCDNDRIGGVNIVILIHEILGMLWLENEPIIHKCINLLIDHFL